MIHRGNKLSIICMGMCLMMSGGCRGGAGFMAAVAARNAQQKAQGSTTGVNSNSGSSDSDTYYSTLVYMREQNHIKYHNDTREAIEKEKEAMKKYIQKLSGGIQGQNGEIIKTINEQFNFIQNALDDVGKLLLLKFSMPPFTSDWQYYKLFSNHQEMKKLIAALKIVDKLPVLKEEEELTAFLEQLKPHVVEIERAQKKVLSHLQTVGERILWKVYKEVIELKELQIRFEDKKKEINKLKAEAEPLIKWYSVGPLKSQKQADIQKMLSTTIASSFQKNPYDTPYFTYNLTTQNEQIGVIQNDIYKWINQVIGIEREYPGTEKGADQVITMGDGKLIKIIQDIDFKGMVQLLDKLEKKKLVVSVSEEEFLSKRCLQVEQRITKGLEEYRSVIDSYKDTYAKQKKK